MGGETDAQAAHDFAFQRWVDRTYARQQRPLTFQAQTVDEWQTWQARLREKIVELAGLVPPPEPCDLAPTVLERTELADAGLIREKVVYQSEPEVWVPAWLLRPLDPPAARLPAVLALHGHGGRWGKGQVAGDEEEHEVVREHIASYNYDYGRQFARRGYVVLCPDARVFGERAKGWWSPSDPVRGYDPCDRTGNQAAILGFSLLALTVWDDRRGIDYLQSRPDVDPERIGVAGLSLGGTRTTYVSTLDDRPQATVISGYLNTFRAFAFDQGFCGSQYVPGLVRWAELPDITALIAPRPLLIEAGIQDDIFPIEASREAHQTLERAYRLLGVEDRLWRDEFDAGHRWSGRLAYKFMDRYLKA
ncbi:MAG: acetylxylan esterase [Dehalococcoidia bacterium]|nr:acetylxylan esterase [Dehalococcoidia bacterium]